VNSRGITAVAIVAALSSVLLPACGTTGSGEGAVATPQSDHMSRHADEAGALKSALVAGNLQSARPPAAWLNAHEAMDGLGGGTEVFVATMRESAGAIVDATSLESAAVDLGRMGSACGACHLATETEITLEWDDYAPASMDIQTHMARHTWAVDRLWEGLTGPSDEAWERGAEILKGDPLDREHTTAEAGRRYRAEAWDQLVHSLAAEAGDVGPTEKGEFFGQVVSACNSCHSLVRNR
jgi:cytochrome c556